MSMGKCASTSLPATWAAAATMASAFSSSSSPSSRLASAQADLTRPRVRINAAGMGWPLMGKLLTARWVCAPQSASAGTCSSPMLSCSVRNSLMDIASLLVFELNGMMNPAIIAGLEPAVLQPLFSWLSRHLSPQHKPHVKRPGYFRALSSSTAVFSGLHQPAYGSAAQHSDHEQHRPKSECWYRHGRPGRRL